MRYILYSPPHDMKVEEIRRPNGEVIPERIFHVGARALYCLRDFPHRRYRDGYPTNDIRMRLVKCKSIAEAENEQHELENYCGETFEIHEFEKGRLGPKIV